MPRGALACHPVSAFKAQDYFDPPLVNPAAQALAGGHRGSVSAAMAAPQPQGVAKVGLLISRICPVFPPYTHVNCWGIVLLNMQPFRGYRPNDAAVV